MLRFGILAALCIAAVVSIPAQAAPPAVPAQHPESVEEPYREAWDRVAGKFDQATAGRHIVALGHRNAETGAVREPTRLEVAEATARLEAMLAPAPEPVAVEAPATTYAPPVASGSGCPASMAPESGSAGYSAYNPSSAATGCYQVIPSTAAAFDCDLSTPAGQDACAAAICAGQGPGAWSASGANPC